MSVLAGLTEGNSSVKNKTWHGVHGFSVFDLLTPTNSWYLEHYTVPSAHVPDKHIH